MFEIAWNAKKTLNFEKKKKFKFFNIKKIHKKFKQHSINIKNYTAHPQDLVHVPAKFRENTAMRFWVTVRKLNVTDRQTDGQTDRRTGRCNISRPGPPAPREIIIEAALHKGHWWGPLHMMRTPLFSNLENVVISSPFPKDTLTFLCLICYINISGSGTKMGKFRHSDFKQPRLNLSIYVLFISTKFIHS